MEGDTQETEWGIEKKMFNCHLIENRHKTQKRRRKTEERGKWRATVTFGVNNDLLVMGQSEIGRHSQKHVLCFITIHD
jgi:hypothetical protein